MTIGTLLLQGIYGIPLALIHRREKQHRERIVMFTLFSASQQQSCTI